MFPIEGFFFDFVEFHYNTGDKKNGRFINYFFIADSGCSIAGDESNSVVLLRVRAVGGGPACVSESDDDSEPRGVRGS